MSSAALMQLRAALVHCATASTEPMLASLASNVACRGWPTKHLLHGQQSVTSSGISSLARVRRRFTYTG